MPTNSPTMYHIHHHIPPACPSYALPLTYYHNTVSYLPNNHRKIILMQTSLQRDVNIYILLVFIIVCIVLVCLAYGVDAVKYTHILLHDVYFYLYSNSTNPSLIPAIHQACTLLFLLLFLCRWCSVRSSSEHVATIT